MNPAKHNFELKYDPGNKEWSLFDNGTLHSSGYTSRKEAQAAADEIAGIVPDGDKPASQKELAAFFTKWRNHIENT